MSTEQTNTYNRLVQIINEHLAIKPEDISMEKRFEEDFGADSLDMVELVMAVEEEFGLAEISDDVRERVLTVEDAVKLIENAEKVEA